jgi:hypothetical protein
VQPPVITSVGYEGALRLTHVLPMRDIFVPQTGQEPCVAGRPFLRVTDFALFISLFVLHFRQ